MFSAIKPYLQIGSVVALTNVAACSTKSCTSEELPASCHGNRTKVTEKEIEETKAEMHSLGDKFGYVHQVYRFSHDENTDLNGNELDDWLLIRTPTGRRHHVVDATIILDKAMTEFAPAKLNALIEAYFMETPDQPSRTVHRNIKDSTTGEYATTDNERARQFGPVLPGVVTFIGEYEESDGLPVREVNFPFNAMMALKLYITPHDKEGCASQVLDAWDLHNPETGERGDVVSQMLAPHNASHGGRPVKQYR